MKSTPRLPDDRPNLGVEHPVREGGLLLLGIGVLVVLVVGVLGYVSDFAVGFVSRDAERTVFAPLLPEVGAFGSRTAHRRPTDELKRQVLTVAGAGPQLGYEYRVTIACNPQPNAFALPGGGIVVTSGLLALLQSENELTWVIGHELGHFEHRHHLRGLGRNVVIGLALGVVGVSGNAAVIEQLTRAAMASHDRDHERQADAVGLAALHGRYGHVGGARQVIEKLTQASGEGAMDRLDYRRSHPAGPERVASIAELTAARGWSERGDVVPLPAELTQVCPANEPDTIHEQRKPGHIAAPRG